MDHGSRCGQDEGGRRETLVASSSQGESCRTASAARTPWRSAARRTRSTGWTRCEGSRHGSRTRLKILLENLLRTEDGANITADHIRALAGVGPDGRAGHRDPVHAGPRDHAGLHRRAVRRRPRHHARGDAGARRRPEQDQPAGAGRAGHRPLGDRRPLRRAGLVRAQRRARVRAQHRALPVPALGPDRVRRLQGRAAGHRHRAPGQHRVPRPRRLRRATASPTRTPWSAPTRTPRWSTASACSAGASAASRPRRPCSASRCRCSSRGSSASSSPASCRRARPRPTWCSRSPRCCASTAWSASSSSSTATASPRCRWPTAPPSAT